MADSTQGVTLGDLLDSSQLGLSILADQPGARDRTIRGAAMMQSIDAANTAEDIVLVSLEHPATDAQMWEGLAGVLGLAGARVIVAWLPPGASALRPPRPWGQHVVLGLPAASDPAALIGDIVLAAALDEQTPTRQLTSLQRSLTRALTDPNPLHALNVRTAKVCNAVVGIVAANGTVRHATGPLPLALLLPEISRAASDSQTFAVAGWYGMAVRIADNASAGETTSWLVAASRRPMFPERSAEAALYIAASLAETSIKIDLTAQFQERAVRSGVFEQVLAMRLERHDAELAGRVASLGISFDNQCRVVVAEPAHRGASTRDTRALDDLYFLLERVLVAENIAHLLVLRENLVIALVQASAATVRRALTKAEALSGSFLFGIGRDAAGVGHVVDSYHDAQLAMRVLRRDSSAVSLGYEDFDFATRLFSDIGLDRMGEWAEQLLAPLADQQTLLDTLVTYFDCEQNIMEAAAAMVIHHNSLRYRLSKVEAALNVNLHDPSAVSSLFLALTALSMLRAEAGITAPLTPGQRSGQSGAALGGDAGTVLSEPRTPSAKFGAAVGPER